MSTFFRTIVTAPLLLALLITNAGAAFAQNATTDLNVDVDAGVLNGNTSSNEGEGSDSSGENHDTSADADMHGSAHLDVGSGFSLKKDDSSVSNSTGSMVAAESVNTESDLEAYAAATLRSSNTIESVDAGSDNLRITYKEPAKFLWVIPFSMNSTIEVSQDGTVRIMRSWYSFLASVDDADARANVESRVKAALEANNALTVRSQARAIEALAFTLDGSSSATASLEASQTTDMEASMDDDGTADQGSGDVAPN